MTRTAPKSNRVLILLFPCFLCLSVAVFGQIDHTDNQQWNDVQLAIPLTKTIDFNVLGTLRLGRNITRPVDERLGLGATFRFGKYFTVAPNYLSIATQPVKNRRGFESRLSLPVTLRFNAGKFLLSDRNLFEHRIRHPGGSSNRYRNKFQIEHPLGAKDWRLSWFVSDEVFYDWAVDRWVRNRFSAGVIKVYNKHFTQDLYYLRQNDGVSVPGDLNVLGTVLRVRL
jgi:Protein of unknown function (DUF2490)